MCVPTSEMFYKIKSFSKFVRCRHGRKRKTTAAVEGGPALVAKLRQEGANTLESGLIQNFGNV
jgi:hypothetical protein